ncbi:ABC transporter ATP-binding protein [Lactobacillus sp. CC-MHH1034]|uniref:ABC transporter ATP-binding protein n=1 Tax=Agrilactobacillus fermenti TaxID=2586909 RepID=UPI001E4B4A28|nr:ABC transporter ATP-binding protein [Agrilactobacillus fermenti]MCD2257482.1 ABC transporter ATP-binding protein [Agrilactobacillus fermenti]
MITLAHLNKVYGQTIALKDLTLNIKSGEVFGFLGHNGAGKSTTIKSIVSIIEPTAGHIEVDGLDLHQNRMAVKQKIGYVPDSPDIFLQLTANEYWHLIAAAYDLPATADQRLKELVTLFDMTAHVDEAIEDFSHGMRQKTVIIGALLPDPDVWILDEPLQSLDPQTAYDLKELIKDHARRGKTVIFSTHVLDTAQQLCDELAILKKGELIYNGSVADLLATEPGTSLEKIYLKMAGRQADAQHLANLKDDQDVEK